MGSALIDHLVDETVFPGLFGGEEVVALRVQSDLLHGLSRVLRQDTVQALPDTEDLFRRREDGKTLVDLRGANARRLLQLGVPAEQIDISGECTMCSHERYWSHRYTKGLRGSQAAGIVL